MKRILFTSVCRPIGPDHGDAPSVGYELLQGQVTRAQGMFSPRSPHPRDGVAVDTWIPPVVAKFKRKG